MTIIHEIEKLKSIAEKALEWLEKDELEHVENELKRIIALDVHELREIYKEKGVQDVAKQCKRVLHDAQNAIKAIEHSETTKNSSDPLVQELLTRIYYTIVAEETEIKEDAMYAMINHSGIGGRPPEWAEDAAGDALGDPRYRRRYIALWAKKIRNTPTLEVWNNTILNGWDTHQFGAAKNFDTRTHPEYSPVRRAAGQRLAEFLQAGLIKPHMTQDVGRPMAILLPHNKRHVSRTRTVTEMTGRKRFLLFGERKPVKRRAKKDEPRPIPELIEELLRS